MRRCFANPGTRGTGDMRGGPRTRAPIFLVVPRDAVDVLQDMRGGDEARIGHLLGLPGLQLVGRRWDGLSGWGST